MLIIRTFKFNICILTETIKRVCFEHEWYYCDVVCDEFNAAFQCILKWYQIAPKFVRLFCKRYPVIK